MGKTRLEAFSDGVIAILITIMVLEFKTPEGHDWADYRAVAEVLAYVLSFVVPRHLLEQPSPHVPRDEARHRRHPVGEPASALLALAGAVRDGVDRRDRRPPVPDGPLRGVL
jgi:hypothetical protein